MQYIEIRIETTSAGIEAVSGALMAMDVMDIVAEDPRDVQDLMDKKQTYDWDYLDEEVIRQLDQPPQVVVYLEDNRENRKKSEEIAETISRLAEEAAGGAFGEAVDFGPLTVTVDYNDDAEWKDKWKEYCKPVRIANRVVVKPTWEDYENKDDSLVIEIDPGMAFGTGSHETTALCVQMMESYLKPGDKVLDVGCGSGILSIAGALLGAAEVLGVDIDPIAVEVADANVCANHVENVCRMEYGDLAYGVDMKANIVVANLMADLVMLLAGDVAEHMAPGARFISSGILAEKRQQVSRSLEDNGFVIEEVREAGGWCCIVANREEIH